jgi:hypothetical protein
MPTKKTARSAPVAAKKRARRKTSRSASSAAKSSSARASAEPAAAFAMPDAAQFAKYAKTLSPEQAFEMYRANAKLALDVIDNALESTAKVRKLQFESEERARSMQRKTARHAAEAGDVQSLMAVGQGAAQEAIENSMQYWGQMFDLIVEIQKRLFSLIESQTAELPGAKEAKAAMAMLPDMTKMQNVVSAMQGVMSSGGSAFEQMQKLMGDVYRASATRR